MGALASHGSGGSSYFSSPTPLSAAALARSARLNRQHIYGLARRQGPTDAEVITTEAAVGVESTAAAAAEISIETAESDRGASATTLSRQQPATHGRAPTHLAEPEPEPEPEPESLPEPERQPSNINPSKCAVCKAPAASSQRWAVGGERGCRGVQVLPQWWTSSPATG